MASPYYLAVHGRLVILGYQPDGDSIRFIADDPMLFRQLHRGYKIRPSARDGSVQLRLESIDAPETHYGKDAQPLGDAGRDHFLARAGYQHVDFKDDGATVSGASPESVRAVILAKSSDPNGRPVSYLLIGDDDAPLDGTWSLLSSDLLDMTLNTQMLAEGSAYPTFYTSTPFSHIPHLETIAAKARQDKIGVWEVDHTAQFQLVNQDSIGPSGRLILPKLFRRATDYLKAVSRGFQGNLAEWLVATTRPENDRVVLPGGVEVPLSDLVEQQNSWIAFRPDLLEIVFVER